jgi:hypothetical protein
VTGSPGGQGLHCVPLVHDLSRRGACFVYLTDGGALVSEREATPPAGRIEVGEASGEVGVDRRGVEARGEGDRAHHLRILGEGLGGKAQNLRLVAIHLLGVERVAWKGQVGGCRGSDRRLPCERLRFFGVRGLRRRVEAHLLGIGRRPILGLAPLLGALQPVAHRRQPIVAVVYALEVVVEGQYLLVEGFPPGPGRVGGPTKSFLGAVMRCQAS